MPSFKTAGTYLLLIVLALASGWAVRYFTPAEDAGPRKAAGKVDYYSRHIHRTVMDETGQPKELLVAETMTHFEGDDHTELTRPILTRYAKQGPPWVYQSETATLPSGGEWIYMNGAVLIKRLGSPDARPLTIVTRNVRVQPNKDYAETDEFVQMFSPPDELSGIGAKVNFGDNIQVTILSHVRRKHEVQPDPGPSQKPSQS